MTVLTFEYEAVDKAGARQKGRIGAATRQEAYRKIASTGVTPLKIRPARERGGRRIGRGRISGKEVAHFTHQLAVLMQARIPISDGLRSIADQEPNQRFRTLMVGIATAIQSGSTITQAIEAHRDVFGDVYVETIRAAERSGAMIHAMEHLAEMLERRTESSQQLRQALLYPVAVTTALGGATVFLVAFVVPKFAEMFERRGMELPVVTRALQLAGESVRSWWWLYGLALLGGWFLFRRMVKSPHGGAILDRCYHRVPYLNRILVGAAVSRFARVFGISLGAGLGLLESLEMSGKASARPLLIEDTELMMERVRQGGRLSEALRSCRYLPSFARRMIAAGEESAELTRMCNVVARHYEREMGYLTKNVSTVVEPIVVALLTGVILVIALAIFLPMWDMIGLVS